MRKAVIAALLCISILVSFAGCTLLGSDPTPDADAKEPFTMNERLTAILEKEDLPTDYDALSLSQKIAIEAIGDMFAYLDKQYPNEVFEYDGYIAQSPLDREQLIVRSRFGKVTVFRDLSGEAPVYEDDFVQTKAADAYASEVNAYLSGTLDETDFIVSVTVSAYDGAPDDGASVLKRCRADTVIFVREAVGEDVFNRIAETTSGYLGENAGGQSVSASYYLVREAAFDPDLPARYAERVDTEIFLRQLKYYRRADGAEKLYAKEG